MIVSKILERLEMNSIKGLINKPKTMASCMVNIRKIY